MKLLLFITILLVALPVLADDDPPQGQGGVYQDRLTVWQSEHDFDWRGAVAGLMYKSILDTGEIELTELIFQARRMRILQNSNDYLFDTWVRTEMELQEYKWATIGLGALCFVLLCAVWTLCKQKTIVIDKDQVVTRIAGLMKKGKENEKNERDVRGSNSPAET